FGNAAGDSLECQHFDNIFEDPLFCDDTVGDYSLCGDSPAYDENNQWLASIGAYGWGCEPCGSPVEASTWGRVKALYR
ncbi:MAG TPA: hypothetical protein VE960_02530, partial [bacterium]|nr:hypothetical protein [bacterium]